MSDWPTVTVKGTIHNGVMTLTDIARSAPLGTLHLAPTLNVGVVEQPKPQPKEKAMQTDPISLAIEARQTRLDDLKRLTTGALIPSYVRYRVPEGKRGRGTAQYAPSKECACRKCERFRIESNDPKVAVRHMATIPHLAHEFEVSPFELAAAVRGVRVMAGENPDNVKRVSKKRGRWNKNRTADSAVRHASLMLARWQKKMEKTHDKVITWARRLKNAKNALEMDARHNETEQ